MQCDVTALQASILLFDGQTLDAVKRIQSSASGFTCLAFSPDCAHLVATSSDRSLLTYSISSGNGNSACASSRLGHVTSLS